MARLLTRSTGRRRNVRRGRWPSSPRPGIQRTVSVKLGSVPGRAACPVGPRYCWKKSFWGGGRNFLEPLMRFVRDDARDLVASQKNDHGLSYRRATAHPNGRELSTKISICESFWVDFRLFQQYPLGSRHRQATHSRRVREVRDILHRSIQHSIRSPGRRRHRGSYLHVQSPR